MNKIDRESDWPFPSVRTMIMARTWEEAVAGEGNLVTLLGSQQLIDSYLSRFGCVPVFDGNPTRRKLARLNENREWVISELDGTSGLECPVKHIEDQGEQLQLLMTHNWYHVGYNVNPELIEFEFSINGKGFSRRSIWGYDTVVPDVEDFYWNYTLLNNALVIEWEDGSNSQVSFSLKRELRAASSLRDGSLTFYDIALQVDLPLFPPSAWFAKYLLSEYWGKQKKTKEEE